MKQIILICIFVLLLSSVQAQEQPDLAATLEVLESGVTVQRVNTTNPIAVRVEAIVGVGDLITTDASGRARITFFADGTSTELEPDTVYQIEEFAGDDTRFILRVRVLIGQTSQQLQRVLDSGSIYEVNTPGMTLAARGTVFAIRVEDSGRSAMLVQEGAVSAASEAASADVPQSFGVRSREDGLSDVVQAASFDELDAALDGCAITIATPDDVSLNVRQAPRTDADLIGYLAAADVPLAFGKSASGDWYRIPFADGFGWVLSTSAVVDASCAGLREFADDFSEPAADTSE